MSDPARVLAQLKRSEVFAADFPKRKRLTHAEFSRLSEDERYAHEAQGADAIRRVSNAQELADLARKLGDAQHEPAVPTLAAIWRDCALVQLRISAGHALRHIGSAEARKALIDSIEDSDWFTVYVAVLAIFDSDPMQAYDRLISYFDPERVRQPGGVVIPARVLSIFEPSSFSNKGPHWSEPDAPQWLRDDRRWLDLCVRLRHDPFLGRWAREVLRYVEASLFQAALARALEKEVPRTVKSRTQPVGDLLARYRNGEHVEVWKILRSFDSIDGDLRQEAEAVATETMKRVAHNVDLLASRLEQRGWRSLSRLRTKPEPADAQIIAEITRITKGPLPPSLLAFWRVVGGVDLAWNYQLSDDPPDLLPGFALDQLDPLCVDSPASVEYLFEEWEATIEETHPELLDPFSLNLAPDYLHKANISGGGPYGVDLPFFGADPIFDNEAHCLPFVDYLRHTLRWGGFSRLDRDADSESVADFVKGLTQGVAPF
jgi:hypothetical protein